MKILLYLRRGWASFRSGVRGPVALACFMAFHWIMVILGITLIADAVYPSVHAQSFQTREEVQDLGRRVGVLEGLDISAQLASIHQELVDTGEAEKKRDGEAGGTAIAAALLVIERAARAMSGKVKEADAT